MRVVFTALSVVLSLALACSSFAQCPQAWLQEPNAGVPGVVGEVRAMTTWDPDCAGPSPSLLAIGGPIRIAGEIEIQTVALWDGTSFAPLAQSPTFTTGPCGEGGLCASVINVLTTFQGDLIAAGRFRVGPSDPVEFDLNIARWTGTSWEGLGTGAAGVTRGLPFDVVGLTTWQGSLVAQAIDGTYVLNPTANTWSVLGSTLNLAYFDVASVQGELFRAGIFAGENLDANQAVQRWNGTSWEGAWLPNDAAEGNDLLVFNNELYAVVFDRPPSNFPTAVRVAKWLGPASGGREWESVGSSLAAIRPRLTTFANELYVQGEVLGTLAGLTAQGILRFDGTDWATVGPASPQGPAGVSSLPLAAQEYQGKLFVGGRLDRAGLTPVSNIASWDGSSWSVLSASGTNGAITGLAVNGSDVYALGGFSQIRGVPAQRIALLRNGTWQQAGSEGFPFAASIAPFEDTAVLGTGEGSVARIFQLVEDQWVQLGSDIFSSGFTTTAYVQRVEGELYAGILNTQSPLYRWEQTFWNPIAIGPSPLTSVQAVTKFQNRLVIGGSHFIDNEGFGQSSCVAFVNEDGTLEVIGLDELNRPILAGVATSLAIYNNELYVGGTPLFLRDIAGTLQQIGGIAKWDGTSWSVPGGGFAGASRGVQVWDMALYQGSLVVSGIFDTAGSTLVRNIASWNGATWSAFSTGMGPDNSIASPVIALVTSVVVDGDDLLAGGSFLSAGGNTSASFARWTCAQAPTCDTIDINNDGATFDPTDIDAFLSVYSEGPCVPATATCNDIDFNNDGATFDPCDIDSFLLSYSEGPCTPCGF